MSCTLLIAFAGLMLSFPSLAESACNSIPPVLLTVGNVTITDRAVVRWGVGLQFGTPPQTIVAALDADWNNTAFWNTSLPCGNLSRPACSWVHGGSFDQSSSTSWKRSADPGMIERNPGGQAINSRGSDNLKLTSELSIEQFPIFMPKPRIIPQSGVGLGPDSTLLKSLYKQKKIASKTWSLFWGWQGSEQQHQMNGNLVLGGFDRAKLGRRNMTERFSDGIGCPSSLLIYLSDISVNQIDGKNTTLFNTAGAALRACIKPDNPVISLPQDLFNNLKKAWPGKMVEHSGGIYPNSLAYEPNNIFAGDITFTLSSGLKITVPNHQIVLPNVAIDLDGKQQIVDDKKIINFDQAQQGAMPVLGQPFLSATYLHVDNDNKEFTVWEAIPTADTELVSVNHLPGGGCNGSDDDKNSSSLSGGAIAGIVLGVAAFIVVGVLGIIWIRRQSSRVNRDSKSGIPLEPISPGMEDKKQGPQELDAEQALAELPDQNFAPQELPGDTPSSIKKRHQSAV